MKIFIQRDGGQLPSYSPKGTIDTDDLLREEAETIIHALKPENLISEGVRAVGANSAIPDGYRYHIQIQEDNQTQEFDVSENALPANAQEAIQMLMQKIAKA